MPPRRPSTNPRADERQRRPRRNSEHSEIDLESQTSLHSSRVNDETRSTVSRNPRPPPRVSKESSTTKKNSLKRDSDDPDFDIESQTHESRARFTYAPTNFTNRLLVGFFVKNKLDSSRIVRIPFRTPCKYLLVVLLFLIAAFLTPQLLPRWLGFEWASPQDLCQNPDQKLGTLREKMRNLTKVHEAQQFLEQQKFNLDCMNKSAAGYFHGFKESPFRFQWPAECTSINAKIHLTERTCVSQTFNTCSTTGGFKKFLLNLAGSCQQKKGPDLCVETTDKNRTESLLELEQNRTALQKKDQNITKTEPIIATANSKVQEMVSRLLTQVDIAADAFILYSLISVIIGVPLVVYKREKGSRIVGATFGLTKMSFMLVFIVALTLYDSAMVIWKETDFDRLFQNFLNDPCYVDPSFSSKRVKLIVESCNNVSLIDQQSDIVLQKMDGVFYDTRLFGFCKDDIRKMSAHPKLDKLDHLRTLYRLKNISSPGTCNSTKLNEDTSVAPKEVSKLRTFLGSGVVAQLLLKFIVTSFTVHLIAFLEPMVLHNGKVEVWGSGGQEDVGLSEEEQLAVSNFARDKHLLPLLIFSFLMCLEGVLIFYGISTSISGADQLEVAPAPLPDPTVGLNFTCPPEIMP